MLGAKEWFRIGAVLSLGSWAFACSGNNNGNTQASSGAGGTGGEGGMAQTGNGSSSSSASSSSSSSASVGAGGFGGDPASFVCDPPPEAGSLYEISAKSYDINDIDPVSMCKYRGKVALIVNTAAA